MAEPVSALPAQAHDGDGVRLTERRPVSMVQVAAPNGAALPYPDEPNRATGNALWLGPRRWLVVDAPAPPGAIVTDLGQARTVIRLSGARARDVLATGCLLDLHPAVFPPGHCAQTVIAHCTVLIHAVDDTPSFDLYVARSYARHFWEFLVDAAAPR